MKAWRATLSPEIVAHRVAIAGQVIEAATGAPLAGVRVAATGPVARETSSRDDGVFWFEDLPDGEYAIDAGRAGAPGGHGSPTHARAGDPGARPAWVRLLVDGAAHGG
jgi:hypothetical protein